MNAKRIRFLGVAVASGMLLVLATAISQAAPLYYSGGTVWDNATSNWATSSGGPYTSSWSDGSDATFEGTASSVSVNSPVTAGSITFTAAGYTVVGANPITVGGLGAVNVTAATGATTISNDLTLSTDNLTLNADTTLTNASSGTLTIDGQITGGSYDLHKTGSGTVDWRSYQNVMTGQIYVDQGTLRLTYTTQGDLDFNYGIFTTPNHVFNVASGATLVGLQNYSFGATDTIILNGGEVSSGALYSVFSHLQINAPSAVTGVGFRVQGTTDWTVTAGGSGSTMSQTGRIGLRQTQALTISVADGSNPGFDFLISGNMIDYSLADHKPVIITGGGVLSLTGANEYSGSTTVTGGATLLVNGTHDTTGATSGNGSDYVIESTGTLGGKGTITLPSDKSITVQSGGALSPGDPLTAAGLGTLTINAPVTLEAGAKGIFDLGAVGSSDLVSMNGSLLTLSGQEFTDFTFNTAPGFGWGTYTLFDAGSISGGLGSVTSGMIDGFFGTLWIDNNQLNLSVVPEPTTLTLLATGLLGLLACAYHRRK